MELLQDAFIYLLAAVVAVPIANRLGLGSVLGYLLAGIVIGPLLGFIGAETEEVKHFAEFGVVMMLFLVGLELQPMMLWRMRTRLLGLGGMQVGITLGLITAIAIFFGLPWQTALAVGMTLALSSTAIVLQTLTEKGLMQTPGGQSSFSVLLFQDIAVIPMLAVIPLLAVNEFAPVVENMSSHGDGPLEHVSGWTRTLLVLGVVAAIIAAGRYFIRPVFRFIAEAKLREIFTAAALLLVIGIALLMDLVGLSPALGTFLAGVVLSSSEYRHELESDIEPFKGLLLGLFFISVGAGIDFELLFRSPILILGMAAALILLKMLVLLFLARRFKLPFIDAWLFGLGLAQAGEFGFVLFGFAKANGIIPNEIVNTLMLVIAITMLFTPLLFIIHERVVARVALKHSIEDRDNDEIEVQNKVILAGVGRFGQVIARLLLTNGYQVTVLDHDPQLIEQMGKTGIKTYYGDPTRPDLLHAAGVEDAELFIAAVDSPESQTILVKNVVKANPNCRIIARAYGRHHVYELENAGAHIIIREMFESALTAGRYALIELGHHAFRAAQKARAFRRHDRQTLDLLREHWSMEGDNQNYIDVMRIQGEELYEIMQADVSEADNHTAEEIGVETDDIDQQGV
ncbi:monovalent cation:proton antiporter-2 (CPA2) family protein [Curvivirga sp.]|uniref:monovalent cation:proton antiporter-2 (CPA2) family protein n=1 Tax=Curvivirga sp. TaxID=2856848 RepID=UPI003B5A0088